MSKGGGAKKTLSFPPWIRPWVGPTYDGLTRSGGKKTRISVHRVWACTEIQIVLLISSRRGFAYLLLRVVIIIITISYTCDNNMTAAAVTVSGNWCVRKSRLRFLHDIRIINHYLGAMFESGDVLDM